MSILIPLVVLSLSAPAPTDRTAAPATVEAPTEPAELATAAESEAAAEPVEPAPALASPTGLFEAGGRAEGPPPPVATPKPPPDRPIRWRVDLGAGVGTTVMRDTAWRAFDDGRAATPLSLVLRADFRLGEGRVFLGGGAMFRRFASDGYVHGRLSTHARVRDPLLFLRMSVMAAEGVDVFVQAGGGPSVVDMSFSSSQAASQRAVVGMVDALAGAALYLPKKWLPRRGESRVTAGLELGAGYTWRGTVDVKPEVATTMDPIGTTGAALGDVAIRGFVWRLGLFVRFQ